jgi:hypothetical protein
MAMVRILAVLLVAVLVAGCGSGIREGKEYESEAALMKQAKGYVVLGRFINPWPMTAVSVAKAKETIELDIPGHGQHMYPGYTGCRMQAVVLKRPDGECAGTVLRPQDRD